MDQKIVDMMNSVGVKSIEYTPFYCTIILNDGTMIKSLHDGEYRSCVVWIGNDKVIDIDELKSYR